MNITTITVTFADKVTVSAIITPTTKARDCNVTISINDRILTHTMGYATYTEGDVVGQAARAALLRTGMLPSSMDTVSLPALRTGWARPYQAHVSLAGHFIEGDRDTLDVDADHQTQGLGDPLVVEPGTVPRVRVSATVSRSVHTTPALWTIEDVAPFWGIAPTAVTTTLARAGVPIAARYGRGGRAYYRAVDVAQARAGRRGQGARTDLDKR